MCIIFWSASSTYSLYARLQSPRRCTTNRLSSNSILAANRDEFLARPTTPAAFHSFAPPSEASPHSSQPSPAQPFLAGLDLSAGGTWLGLSTKGGLSRLRFSTLTNYTETIASTDPPRPSRGNLVRHFLDEDDAASLEQYLERVEQDKAAYAGFNLLVGELGDAGQWRMGYVSNREDKGGRVVEGGEELDGPSVKGLSNATLDVDWPKVVSGCRAVKEVVQSTALGNEVELLQGLWDALRCARNEAVLLTRAPLIFHLLIVPQVRSRSLTGCICATPSLFARLFSTLSLHCQTTLLHFQRLRQQHHPRQTT